MMPTARWQQHLRTHKCSLGFRGFASATFSRPICVPRHLQQRAKYNEALTAYEKCLEAFVYALKWEKNPSIKTQFEKFAKEYMERAEKIKVMLSEPVETKPKKAVAASEGDKDKNKMREAVESVIVQDKPNVKWDDIAGLEQVGLRLSKGGADMGLARQRLGEILRCIRSVDKLKFCAG